MFKEGEKQHEVGGKLYDRISSVGRTLEDYGIKEGIEYAFAQWAAGVAVDIIECAKTGEQFNRRTVSEQFDGWVYEEMDVRTWSPESIKKYIARHPRNMLQAAADRGTITHMVLTYADQYGWPAPEDVGHLVEDWMSSGKWLCDQEETALCMAHLCLWAQEHNPVMVLVETPIWSHDLQVAGRADWYAVMGEELWLLDVKTRASVSGPRVEQVIQLGGYLSCDKALGKDGQEVDAPLVTKAGALVCAPDGANLYEVQELEKWKTMFKKTLDLKRATASVAGMTKGHGKCSLDLGRMLKVTA